MGLKLNTASGGSVSIEPSNTASNYTLTVPAQTGTVIASDSSGNVGIGTSSPTQKLDISGKVNVDTSNAFGKINLARYSGTLSCYLKGTDSSGSANGFSFGYSGGNAQAITFDGTNILFYNNSDTTERMRIDSSGNLLVGTTSTVNSGRAVIDYASVGGRGLAIVAPSNANGAQSIHFYAGSTQVGNVSVTTTATSYNSGSDYRLKENIQPMTNALSKVALLKPCTFTWKINGSDGQGFIAHELQEVVPDCVTGEKDAVDADGKPVYQGIDTSFLVATLTAAIQELKAQLDESNLILTSVKTELDTVKTELATLKGTA